MPRLLDVAAELTPALATFLRSAVALAQSPLYERLLVTCDLPLPETLLARRSRVRRKLVCAVTSEAARAAILERDGDVETLIIPPYQLSRMEKLKLSLIAGVAHGVLRPGQLVLGLVGRAAAAYPDSLMVSRVAEPSSEEAALAGALPKVPGKPEVVEAALQLALDIGAEGWEGHGVGALLVLGDARRIMERSRQLALNPYQGYSESERNILDPDVRETARAFATLDGAFVLRDDGVLVAAGRYLLVARPVTVPLGLGARHMAGAGITADTDATAFVVSQTSGKVRVFRRGALRYELTPSKRRV